MTFTEIVAEQKSPEWIEARLGCLTASVADAVDNGYRKDGKPTAARRDLLTRLVVERLTGRSAEDPFTNGDLQRGNGLEPQARVAYEFATGANVRQVGFVRSIEHMAGCSPDGVVGDYQGLIECKAPRSKQHLVYLRDGGVPSDYRAQLVHQMWITGVRWVDFVSFDPLMPDRLQLFVVRMGRNEDEIAAYAQKALAFLREVEAEEMAVRTMADMTAVMSEVVAR